MPLTDNATGERLGEGPAIVQYLADQVPGKALAPSNGTMARYRVQEWLNFISSELHKGFSPLFNPATPEDFKPAVKQRLAMRLEWVDTQLEGRDYLMGAAFTVPDAYLFTVVNWCRYVGLDIASLKHLGAFMARMAARPAVREALAAEGLNK